MSLTFMTGLRYFFEMLRSLYWLVKHRNRLSDFGKLSSQQVYICKNGVPTTG